LDFETISALEVDLPLTSASVGTYNRLTAMFTPTLSPHSSNGRLDTYSLGSRSQQSLFVAALRIRRKFGSRVLVWSSRFKTVDTRLSYRRPRTIVEV